MRVGLRGAVSVEFMPYRLLTTEDFFKVITIKLYVGSVGGLQNKVSNNQNSSSKPE